MQVVRTFLSSQGRPAKSCLLQGDGADRTGIDAFTAEETFGVDIIRIKGRPDLGAEAAHGKIEDFVDLDFIAGPDAAAAEDALVEIPLDHRVGCFDGITGRGNFKPGFLDPQPVDQILQFTICRSARRSDSCDRRRTREVRLPASGQLSPPGYPS